ncbi:uncharacterized protein [Eucyclogobius newberryi]|uniref:uncharacterized protein n=1 Tax=Eucyclogobius newberryi TaxID=166745 RepID=UPI003B5CF10D
MMKAYNDLPETMNPDTFPAKLWCMVNDPANVAISWDNTGDFVVICQPLFEEFVLSHCYKKNEGNFAYFKTTKFSSFVRQLNLYGFKKKEPLSNTDSSSPFLHFLNPNFKRDKPALLINLKRLTVDNKAKMDRGIEVKSRPRRQSHHACHDEEDNSERHSMKGRAGNRPFHPYTYRKPVTPETGTPDPSRHLASGHFVPSLGHPYSAVPSSALQQGVTYGINYGVPDFTGLQPQNEQYYYPSCQHMQLMPNGLNVPFPSMSYNWANYPLNLGGDGPGPSSPNKNKDNNKTD